MTRSRLRRAAGQAGFALATALAVLLGRATAGEEAASLLWPAAGVGFVWVASCWGERRARRRAVALLALAGTGALLLVGERAGDAVLFGVLGAVEALTACWVQRRLQPRGSRLRRPGDLWVLVLALGTGALVAGLPVAALALAAPGSAAADELLLSWVVRHSVSALGVAVVWLRIGDRQRPAVPAGAGRLEHVLVLGGAVAVMTWLYRQPGSAPLAFLVVPSTVWVGLRMSARTALPVVVAGAAGLAVSALLDMGPFHALPVREAVLDVQLLALVLFAVVVPLVLHREEREGLHAEVLAAHREAAVALEHQARHDALTGLPNRVLLRERLTAALAEGPAGVLFCDLDGFKDVNDSAGHGTGDEVLREVAARFAARVRAGDTLARLGGDEFAVVCPGVGGLAALGETAEALLAALRAPVTTAAGSFRVGVSIGAVLAPRDPTPHQLAESLLAAADSAMYSAKRAGKNRVHLDAGDPAAGLAPAQAVAPPASSWSSGGTRQ